ncbi:MAG: hypothetical protein DCC75_05855 [Proteobacteria bacterium]|nr:MAG: hypothetical protein DCC75_05855 [Pseudomonadota bacterium]
MKRGVLAAFCLLCLVTVIPYLQVLYNGFCIVDDPAYIVDNQIIRQGLNRTTLEWSFTNPLMGHFAPLTWLTHGLDSELFGDWAGGHHLTSLLVHLLAAVLLFRVLLKLELSLIPSFLGAALFASHPMGVEAVAWASSKKDLLSGLFWLLAFNCYLNHHRRSQYSSSKWYWLALGCMLLGGVCKSSIIALPLLLVAFDLFGTDPLRISRYFRSRLFLGKLPFFALSIAVGAATIWFQDQVAGFDRESLEPWAALLRALSLAQHYLFNAVAPLELVFPEAPLNTAGLEAVLALFIFVLVTSLTWRLRRDLPLIFCGWIWFCIALLPVLQLVPVGLQEYSNRWGYIALMGLAVIAAQCFHAALSTSRQLLRGGVLGGALVIGATFSVLTCQQVQLWRSDLALFSTALKRNPNNVQARLYLGAALSRAGALPQAANEFLVALKLEPTSFSAFSNLHRTLELLGRGSEIISYIPTAPLLKGQDNLAQIVTLIGFNTSLAEQYRNKTGKDALGVAYSYWSQKLKESPRSFLAAYQLGNISSHQGQYERALDFALRAMEQRRWNSAVHALLAQIYRGLNQGEGASRHIYKAWWFNPQ